MNSVRQLSRFLAFCIGANGVSIAVIGWAKTHLTGHEPAIRYSLLVVSLLLLLQSIWAFCLNWNIQKNRDPGAPECPPP